MRRGGLTGGTRGGWRVGPAGAEVGTPGDEGSSAVTVRSPCTSPRRVHFPEKQNGIISRYVFFHFFKWCAALGPLNNKDYIWEIPAVITLSI